MWEGQQLLGTIFVRWRRKHYFNHYYFCGASFVFDILILSATFLFSQRALNPSHSNRWICNSFMLLVLREYIGFPWNLFDRNLLLFRLNVWLPAFHVRLLASVFPSLAYYNPLAGYFRNLYPEDLKHRYETDYLVLYFNKVLCLALLHALFLCCLVSRASLFIIKAALNPPTGPRLQWLCWTRCSSCFAWWPEAIAG